MEKTVRRALPVILVVALAASQLVPVTRTNPPVEGEIRAPAPVRAVLRRACYDCHSRETVWPWYSRIAPASWLVAHDVSEGRAKLDFSAWDRLDAGHRAKAIRKIQKEIADGEMPPWYYGIVHRAAALSADDRAKLREWAAGALPGADGGGG
ncbi:MAG: heme-binding domain-containing protein [Gemmatimonadota bacterium]